MQIEMAGLSDVGRVRKNNEDFLLYKEDLRLGIVCDGIGGREGGEVASKLAAETMQEELKEIPDSGLASFLKAAGQKANKAIIAVGEQNPILYGMGTTMECLLFRDEVLYITHIGDSRTYLFDRGNFWQLTIDHNVRTLAFYGDIPEEMGNLAGGDALVRALGIEKKADCDIYTIKLSPGQIFLTASDGLFDMLADSEISDIINKSKNDQKKLLGTLVSEANRCGGNDNITVLISRVNA